MARQNAPFDFKAFDKGFITDASPIDFPDGASLDEANFWIMPNGERHRRLGLVPTRSEPTSGVISKGDLGFSGVWHNVGGFADQHFLFIQVGNSLDFYKYNGTSLSELVGSVPVKGSSTDTSATVLDGDLVIVDGSEKITVVTCNNPTVARPSLEVDSSFRLEIRDTFGIPDKIDRYISSQKYETIDLQNPKYISYRPIVALDKLLGSHLYNLRNQSFGQRRLSWDADVSDAVSVRNSKQDPISMFERYSQEAAYPSNADNVLTALSPNPEQKTNRTVDRYDVEMAYANLPPNSPAPKGHFIIDALDRSDSRRKAYDELVKQSYADQAPTIVPNFPEDRSTGGAKTIAEYGGRVWYAGFEDTTDSSTRLSSFLLYSQISRDRSAIARCYQSGDPTDSLEPEVIATDGGAIAIDGAYNIKRLEVLGTTLLVFAENGVWAISGSDGNYFSPTSQRIERLSTKGCISARSVVIDDHVCMYWSEDGIYSVSYEQQGRLEVKSLTRLKIQQHMNNMTVDQKASVHGAYDGQQGQAVWVVHPEYAGGDIEVLRYHVKRDAFTRDLFYYNDIYTLTGFVKVPPFSVVSTPDIVTVEGEQVTSNGVEVVLSEPETISAQYSTVAIGVYNDGDAKEAGAFIGSFTGEDFKDWETQDAEGFILTGFVTGDDIARRKQVPYLTVHFNQTESKLDPISQLPTPESGCLLRSRWDWTTEITGNKWGPEHQIYRLKRYYIPSGYTDVSGGNGTVVTRNKLRGRGRAVALHYRTQPEKDCQLLGWNFQMTMNNNI